MRTDFIEWAKKHNWKIGTTEIVTALPGTITNRYPIPAQWLDFIQNIQICENASAEKWFLTPKDYLPAEDGFQRNTFELESLSYAADDDEKGRITAFWNTHLPIFLSVDGEYSYIAIDTTNGRIVSGYEPEYEEISVIAEDFDSFLNRIISGEIAL